MEQYGMKIRCTAFKKNIVFLWGINYNGDIDSKKGAGYGKSWKTTGRG